MRPQAIFAKGLSTAIALALVAAPALSEEEAASPPPGLPAGVDWTLHFNATVGSFGFADSFYTDPKPEQPSGDLGDNWWESSIVGGISAVYTTDSSAQIYGKVSAAGERTDGGAPDVIGDDASSFEVEDLYIGWRSGNSIGDSENLLDFTVGPHAVPARARAARVGRLLGGRFARRVLDQRSPGLRHGRDRAVQARRAHARGVLSRKGRPAGGWFRERAVGRELRVRVRGEHHARSDLHGLVRRTHSRRPQRDGLKVYNLRAFTAPFPNLEGLSFELEYAEEDNDLLLDSTAWNALVGYQFESSWQPKFSYRYAVFEGDDPTTPANEAFDGLFTGFYDWGTWWQGEIAGEYFVSNSNLISHQLRLHVKPNDAISTGLDPLRLSPRSAGLVRSARDLG